VTASTSPSFSVNVGAFAKLQLLMPGETAAPGTATGHTGTPSTQNKDSLVTGITVNAVDANWNLVNTASDTVGITSSDTHAALPGNAMQTKLRALGCDIEWLMTGKGAEDQKKERARKADVAIAFHAPGAMSEEQRKAIQKMIDETGGDFSSGSAIHNPEEP
jgi:hypothetical protein